MKYRVSLAWLAGVVLALSALSSACFRTPGGARPSSRSEGSGSTSKTPSGNNCPSSYQPSLCINSDEICSVNSDGCRICTCQTRIDNSQPAPSVFVPGTGVPY